MQNAYDSHYSLLCKWRNPLWKTQAQQEYMLIDVNKKKLRVSCKEWCLPSKFFGGCLYVTYSSSKYDCPVSFSKYLTSYCHCASHSKTGNGVIYNAMHEPPHLANCSL